MGASVIQQWIWDETFNLIDGVPIITDLSRGVFRVPCPTALRKCPQGHDLIETKIGESTSGYEMHNCDACGAEIESPDCIHRCNRCDYDLCHSCYRAQPVGDKSYHRDLRVPEPYLNAFKRLKSHLEEEVVILGDETFVQEIQVIERLLGIHVKQDS